MIIKCHRAQSIATSKPQDEGMQSHVEDGDEIRFTVTAGRIS
jgi:hypothetical protein